LDQLFEIPEKVAALVGIELTRAAA